MANPDATMIPRAEKTRHAAYDPSSLAPADWNDVESRLSAGPGPCWLSTTLGDAAHVRPVFAAWTGDSFVVASNPGARKSRALHAEPRCSVSIDLSELHLVVEGHATRLTAPNDLHRAAETFERVFGWPTRVAGEHLDADGAAPSSGGPPFEVFEISPVRAYGFPTDDQFEPTRWRWR